MIACPAPIKPALLADGELHLWQARLTQPTAIVDRLWRTLAADERVQADRFVRERDRRRHIVARGVLRSLMGRYARLESSAITFTYGPHGKPALAAACGVQLEFNLSHSDELALYAVTGQQPVGVDVERLRPVADLDQIADRFFSRAESAALRTLPAAERPAAFFRCWTRKEAFIKATGEGLALPLDAFDVTLAPGEPARLLHVRDRRWRARDWSFLPLEPADGFVAAVVAPNRDWRLIQRQWTVDEALVTASPAAGFDC